MVFRGRLGTFKPHFSIDSDKMSTILSSPAFSFGLMNVVLVTFRLPPHLTRLTATTN